MSASTFIDRRAALWLAALLIPLALAFGGSLSEYALPIVPEPGTLNGLHDGDKMEEIARLGRWIAMIPYARIVFPGALILSVWLMTLIVAYGRARYLARKDRREEARLYDELVNRSRVGYLAVDKDGVVAATNPALENMLGADTDWLGSHVSEMGLSADELLPGEVVVVTLKTVDGRMLPALASTMEGDAETHHQIIITPLRDIAIQQGHVTGGHRRHQALLRNINHELRTPLSIILGSATLLETDVSEENAELVDAIRVGGERLMSILETLVLLSELESAGANDQVGSIELVSSLHALLGPKLAEARHRGLETTMDLPSDPVYVRVNAAGLEHVCRQLVDNAIKFTDSGSVTVRCEVDSGKAIVSVIDTGRGMDERTLRNVLADFRDERKSRRSTGSIGLSLAKLLADEMGGHLALTSSPGHGTTATVDFSLAAPAGSDVGLAA